ncbi:MAG: hypothetical protein LBC97_04395 [Bifidobacteriaceae bacterium]|jgi:hypothetical protein|nr:hypothetical protein [Bifidobacteriaceae bacterium]
MSITTLGPRRAALATLAALAIGAAGLALAAPARALSAGLDPADRLGDVTLDIAGGRLEDGGPRQLATATGCPENYQRSSRVFLVWADGSTHATQAPAYVKTSGAGTGLDGQPINRVGDDASRWGQTGFPKENFQGRNEVASYIVTCDPGTQSTGGYPAQSTGYAGSKFFSIDIEFSWGSGGSDAVWQVYVPPPPADSSESGVVLSVPEEQEPDVPTGLTISVKPGTTVLEGPAARVQGTPWQAAGYLDFVTVNDDRRDASAPGWTLNGRASNFTSATTADTIPSTGLGWAPERQVGPGSAGPEVAPGASGGLSVDQVLAYGEASDDANVQTQVGARLTLNVPSGVSAGDYAATLTLTLI